MRGVIAILAVGLLVLAGCKNETAGPSTADYERAKKQVAARQQHPPKRVPPKQKATGATPGQPGQVAPSEGHPSMTASAGFTYDPTGKRDPFRSFILEQAKRSATDERGPLEQFDLSQLSVLAVVWDTDVPRALIADPSGRGYIVSKGAALGKNEGKVIRIDDNLVLVKETYVDWLGERTTKDIEMRIHRQGKGGDL